MWIKELHIKHFGKFTDRRIELSPGINLIYGENESGKSTIHTFIKGCLYGIRKMRGRASKKDEFSHYQPWDNGNYYAGSIRFVCADKVFRLERDFATGTDGGLLVCETDGELLSLENGDLDMLLGGVGEAAFLNTVSIGQLKSETDEGLVSELQNYIANYQEGGTYSIHMDQALQSLKQQKKELERQMLKEEERNEGRVRQLSDYMGYLEDEKQSLDEKLGTVEEEIAFTRRILADLETQQIQMQEEEKPILAKKIGRFKESADAVREEEAHEQKKSIFKWLGIPVRMVVAEVGILAMMLLFCFLMGDFEIMKELVFIMILISVVIIGGFHLVNYWSNSSEERNAELSEESEQIYDEEVDDFPEEERDTRSILLEKEEKNQTLTKLLWQKEHLQSELGEKQIQIENCQQEILQCKETVVNEKMVVYKENKEAIVLAYEQIAEAMRQMQSRLGVSLKQRTSEIFSEITNGYYTQVQINENICVGVHTKERYVPIEQLSRGTIWQVYFAYRMAAGELLTEEEELPIILDDAFVMYDEVRLIQVLAWLGKQKKQVLLFTCQKREEELLEQLEAAHHKISLV